MTTIDTAVIPCGGLGTRLYPITRWIPKELLPVGLKPLLFWTLDEVADAGLMRAIIVTNPHKPLLEAVARSYKGPLELTLVPQHHPRGLGDALLSARDELGDAPFVAVLPDNLFDGPNPTTAVLETYHTTGLATVLLAQVSREDEPTKGATAHAHTARSSDGTLRVTRLGEKGSGRFPAGADRALTPIGRTAFAGDVLLEFEEQARSLPLAAEVDDVPILRRLAARGALAGVVCAGKFHDVGVPEGYRQAVSEHPASFP